MEEKEQHWNSDELNFPAAAQVRAPVGERFAQSSLKVLKRIQFKPSV